MPDSVTLQDKIIHPKRLETRHGISVAWESRGYAEDWATLQENGGLFDLSHWSLVQISGPDARDYLQRMSTAPMLKLSAGNVCHGAFLTGRGTVVTLGFFAVFSDKYVYAVPPPQGSMALEHIEKFHFAEKFETREMPEEMLWGIAGRAVEKLGIPTEPLSIFATQLNEVSAWGWRDDVMKDFCWVVTPRNEAKAIGEWAKQNALEWLGYRTFERLRIQAGIPEVGSEVSEKDIILETGFDRAVARNKGCYPGQEVVERIFTYGQVNRKLMPVVLKTESSFPALPFTAMEDGKTVASVVSLSEDPQDAKRAVGLAYVHKNFLSKPDDFRAESFPVVFRLTHPEPRE